MASKRLTPVVIGVGDFKNRSQKVDDAIEPLQLMYQAILLAVLDSHVSTANAGTLRSSIDSLDIVASWTWPYADLPSLLSKKLGVEPRHKHYSEHGGNKPGKLFDEAARRISFGESRVAVVTGGEALASLSACAAAEKLPPPGWTKLDQEVTSVFSPTTRPLKEDLGAVHSIGAPIQVYPLFENGFRAHRQQSIQENNKESAELYAEFAKIAEDNPASWSYKQPPASAQIIGTVSKKNRMICFPYPLLMNAFNTVNLAGACILTSTEYAEELGVPKRRWIYPLGGAGTEDSRNFWERPNFYSSPSIARSLDAGMEVSGLKKDEIDFYDFYSCFPIVPKLACQHLGLPLTKSPKRATLLGGLTSFGGAGNNYSMHALTTLVQELRKAKGERKHGLVLANGGVATYQYVVCLSSRPRKDGSPYPEKNPLPESLLDVPSPQVDVQAEGEAVVETYTVEFHRDGTPLRGHIVGRLRNNGHRFIANHGDQTTLQQLTSAVKEQIGRSGWVSKDTEKQGRNLFSYEAGAKI